MAPFGIPPLEATRLHRYAHLLETWSTRINLVAQGDLSRLWDRHILDSAQLVPLIPTHARSIVDLGSGAGLPGLVLAILTARETHLV
ncbi:MAG: RsmG family class I SAM-dependent methyltransferase, partial [Acetobacteraceae bacterium]